LFDKETRIWLGFLARLWEKNPGSEVIYCTSCSNILIVPETLRDLFVGSNKLWSCCQRPNYLPMTMFFHPEGLPSKYLIHDFRRFLKPEHFWKFFLREG